MGCILSWKIHLQHKLDRFNQTNGTILTMLNNKIRKDVMIKFYYSINVQLLRVRKQNIGHLGKGTNTYKVQR